VGENLQSQKEGIEIEKRAWDEGKVRPCKGRVAPVKTLEEKKKKKKSHDG